MLWKKFYCFSSSLCKIKWQCKATPLLSTRWFIMVQIATGPGNRNQHLQRRWLFAWSLPGDSKTHICVFKWQQTFRKMCPRKNPEPKRKHQCNGLGLVSQTQTPWSQSCPVCFSVCCLPLPWRGTEQRKVDGKAFYSWRCISWECISSKRQVKASESWQAGNRQGEAPARIAASPYPQRSGSSWKRGHYIWTWGILTLAPVLS